VVTSAAHSSKAPAADIHATFLGRVARSWAHWDSGWYESIAAEGYWYVPGQQSPVAFFPGYPLLVRAVAALGLDYVTAGFLVTLVCGQLAIFLFARWAMSRAGEGSALLAGFLLILYPFAFYLYGALYSDALMLVLVTAAFLCLEGDAIVVATLCGAAATLTRPVAPAVVLGLLVRQLERRRQQGAPIRPTDFLPVLSIGGMGIYMLYLWKEFGDPLAFVHVQSAPGWEQAPGWHTWLKIRWFQLLVSGPNAAVFLRHVVHAVVAVGALMLVLPTRRLLGWGYAIYALVAVGIPTLASKDFMGLGRYVLMGFPLYLSLALLLRERVRFSRVWIAVSGLALAGLTLGFGKDCYLACKKRGPRPSPNRGIEVSQQLESALHKP
jgi:hypothetical protein